MNRSKDLDTVAPDDEVLISPPEKEKTTVTKIKEEKSKTKENLNKKIYNILGHTKNSFSSTLVKPKVLKFAEQNDSEKIFLAVRPHWITNLSWIFVAFIMLFVPFFFKYLTFLDFFPSQYRLAITLFWYLITFISAFERFLSWYFDVFLITDERVVDIDCNNLLNKHFAEADLSMIQDVSSSVRGVFGTFFNYGNVLIQTASETNQITFDNVPNPEKIIKLLKELRDSDESKGEKHE